MEEAKGGYQGCEGRRLLLQGPRRLFFWLCRTACGILVPRPGLEPEPPAVEAPSLNHWTAGEVPEKTHLLIHS